MASGHDTVQLEDPPASFRSAVWEHYGFNVTYDNDGKKVVDKTATVCKHCATRVAYASGNTSNMMNHLRRHHPSVSVDSTKKRDSGTKVQILLSEAFKQPLHAGSDRAKSITKALGGFIAKDMQPFSVVEDAGFRHMIKVLESRYNILSRKHFSNTVITELYEQTRRGCLYSLCPEF